MKGNIVQQIWDRFRITITTTTTSRRTVIVMICIKMTATATAITDADTTISDFLVSFVLPILLDRTIYIYIYISLRNCCCWCISRRNNFFHVIKTSINNPIQKRTTDSPTIGGTEGTTIIIDWSSNYRAENF